MKAFVVRSPGGLDSLKPEDVPAPGPLGPGQIRVAMRAASLNYRDLMYVSGAMKRVDDLIPCSDGAGEVIEAAPDVSRVKLGDRVMLSFNPDWIGGEWQPSPAAGGRGGAIQGVLCEQVVVHQSEAVVLSPHMSFEEGATLPCAAVTAWHSLCGTAPLLPGMSVLLQGAGGVSIFALQFAKLFGARVIMTSSSASRCARLKTLGADETIDYQSEPEWNKAVRALTDEQGVDVTVEVGGAKTIDRALAATRVGGRLAMVGLLTGVPNVTSSMFASGVTITPIKVGSRQDLEALSRAMAFHKVHPVIDSRYPFQRFNDALQHLKSGKQMGKIVISIE